MNKIEKTHVPEYKFIYKTEVQFNQGDIETTFKTAITSKIHLDPKKNHKITVTVLDKDRFSIVIDGKTKFFLSKEKTSIGQSEEYTVVQEKIENKTVFQSFKDF